MLQLVRQSLSGVQAGCQVDGARWRLPGLSLSPVTPGRLVRRPPAVFPAGRLHVGEPVDGSEAVL